MEPPKRIWPWVVASIVAVVWALCALFTAWTCEFTSLLNLLTNPSYGAALSLDPSIRVAMGWTGVWSVVAVVLAFGIFQLLGKRPAPSLLAVLGGGVGAFLFNVGGSMYGATVDPPEAHIGDLLGMKPVALAGDALIMLVPAVLGALVILVLARQSRLAPQTTGDGDPEPSA